MHRRGTSPQRELPQVLTGKTRFLCDSAVNENDRRMARLSANGIGENSPRYFLSLEAEEVRMRRKRLVVACVLLFAMVTLTMTAADVRKIMEAVYHQDTSRDATWRAVMEVTDKKGTVRRKRFSFRRLGSLGNSKTLVRFTDPPDVRGVGLLSINIKGTADRQWMYTPAIQRIRRIAPQEKSRRFLGTDFTHEDMAERVLDDFEYRMLSESDAIDGHKTYKIEAKPVAPNRSQYKYIYLWVPQDIPYVIHAEMYDQRGQLVRVFHASALEKISGIWVAKRVEMSTPSEKTKTILLIEDIRFNVGLKDDLFTPQAVEKGEAF